MEISESPSGRGAPQLVSVVIPSFNRAALLIETLESIARAEWRPIEVIVADDGSTDDTADRVAVFTDKHHDLDIRFLPLPHRGAIQARNSGVEAATGHFVYFLDSDDLMAPHGLSAMIAALADPAIPYCVGQLVEADLAGQTVYSEGHSDPSLDLESVVASQWATIVGLYRREVLDRLGAFDESLAFGEDKEFLWRIVAGSAPGIVIPDLVAIRRNHAFGQLTDSYSVQVMGRHTVHALDGFVAWAERTGHLRPAIARACYPRLWIAATRSGATGDRATVERAVALAGRLQRHAPSGAHRNIAWLIAIAPQFVLRTLLGSMYLVRRVLHALRNQRRRMNSAPR